MKDFRNFQHVRILTEEGTIANGDYILDGVTIRCQNGLLNDSTDEDGAPLPAIETHDGNHIEHWQKGVLHCDNAPAVVDNIDKYEVWFCNGEECPPKN
jgi:hypothetical protein